MIHNTAAKAIDNIGDELELRLKEFRENNKLVEAQRLEERTKFDLEMIKEIGYCSVLRITRDIYLEEIQEKHHLA